MGRESATQIGWCHSFEHLWEGVVMNGHLTNEGRAEAGPHFHWAARGEEILHWSLEF